MSNEIHFAPDVQGTIASTRAKSFEWTAILGELIDNAFDAGATRVEISIDGHELTVDDDGNGCDDIGRMLTMGKHARKSTTRLGRYGVGLKDAAWWVGGPTRIITHHAGRRHTIRIAWDSLANRSAPMPSVADADDGKRGTRIRFESMSKERRFPSGTRFDSMVSELAFIYSPALKNGKQIVFRRGNREPILLKRYELPRLAETIDTTITVEGKSARVFVGIVADGVENLRHGISYTHAFRVITHGALGCGGLGSSRIAGWVSLGDGWTLARNKDDVTAYKDELGEAVFEKIRPLVEKASSHALSIQSQSLADGLTSRFRGIVGGAEADAKAKRDSAKNQSGRVNPTGSGKKHKRAKKTQSGSRFREVKAGQFRIDFGPCIDGAIGRVDIDGRTIILADNHVAVQRAKDANDERSLLMLAVVLFASHEAYSEAPLLSIIRDGSCHKRTEQIAGHLLAEMCAERPALKSVA